MARASRSVVSSIGFTSKIMRLFSITTFFFLAFAYSSSFFLASAAAAASSSLSDPNKSSASTSSSFFASFFSSPLPPFFPFLPPSYFPLPPLPPPAPAAGHDPLWASLNLKHKQNQAKRFGCEAAERFELLFKELNESASAVVGLCPPRNY